jgi:tetratricopeptide (TPR) repeat protein
VSRARHSSVGVALVAALLLPAGNAVRGAGDTPDAQVRQAVDLMKRREWTRAEELLDRLLHASPSDATPLYWKAYLLFQTGRYRESSAIILKYLESKPDSAAAHKVFGLDLFMLDKHEAAEAELKHSTELAATDAEALYYLGRIYFTRNNFPAALEAFQKVVAVDSASVRGYNHLGQTYEGLARFDAARKAYQKAIDLETRQAATSEWPYFNLGVLCNKEGRFEEAACHLRAALARNPAMAEAKVQLAIALSASNQLDEAQDLLEQTIRAEPENAVAHFQIGRLLMKRHKPDEAQRHFELFQSFRKQ